MRFHARNVSVGESGDEYSQVSFDCELPGVDDFDTSLDDSHYLLVQRQFEDDDGGVCYIETHDHDTYTGHFPLACKAEAVRWVPFFWWQNSDRCTAEKRPTECPLRGGSGRSRTPHQ